LATTVRPFGVTDGRVGYQKTEKLHRRRRRCRKRVPGFVFSSWMNTGIIFVNASPMLILTKSRQR
ncbi:hypothetical protein, partial [Escherichia coli]|uniref:hypothetical protein n=1 Tax=Escherichia coli TaxID=562 RepID=UPI001F49406F